MKAESLMVLEKMHNVLDDPKMHRLTPRSPRSKVDSLGKTLTKYKQYHLWFLSNEDLNGDNQKSTFDEVLDDP